MNAVHDKRCLNHRDREAVARCPSCHDFYCRECVTEHQGRIICAKCLVALTGKVPDARARFSFATPLLAALAFVLVWCVFFLLGRALLMLPDSFHDGTVWSATDSEDEP